jgi:hypothetical protein
MGFFDGIESAKVASDAQYVRPGVYELEVLETKTGKSPKDGRQFAVAEYKVLAAAPGSECKVGDKVSHMVMMVGLHWQGDIKAMVAAISGCPSKMVDAAGTELFFGPQQPARGKKVNARAWNTTTRGGKQFTKIRYDNPHEPKS